MSKFRSKDHVERRNGTGVGSLKFVNATQPPGIKSMVREFHKLARHRELTLSCLRASSQDRWIVGTSYFPQDERECLWVAVRHFRQEREPRTSSICTCCLFYSIKVLMQHPFSSTLRTFLLFPSLYLASEEWDSRLRNLQRRKYLTKARRARSWEIMNEILISEFLNLRKIATSRLNPR